MPSADSGGYSPLPQPPLWATYAQVLPANLPGSGRRYSHLPAIGGPYLGWCHIVRHIHDSVGVASEALHLGYHRGLNGRVPNLVRLLVQENPPGQGAGWRAREQGPSDGGPRGRLPADTGHRGLVGEACVCVWGGVAEGLHSEPQLGLDHCSSCFPHFLLKEHF